MKLHGWEDKQRSTGNEDQENNEHQAAVERSEKSKGVASRLGSRRSFMGQAAKVTGGTLVLSASSSTVLAQDDDEPEGFTNTPLIPDTD